MPGYVRRSAPLVNAPRAGECHKKGQNSYALTPIARNVRGCAGVPLARARGQMTGPRPMTTETSRPSGRTADALRPVSFELGVNKHAEGSCLVKFGDTQVLCMASVEETIPPWLRGGGKGWVTAEYGMLPRATNTRMAREASKGRQSGRTQEIQRLIGRALRAVTDLAGFGEIQIRIDCDVIQADGGT